MPQQQQQKQEPVITKFLYEYRKKLSTLKVKSFYSFHLCQKKCLQNNLQGHPDQCLKVCQLWLKDFYDFKRDSHPYDAQTVLIQAENKIQQLQNNTADFQFQKKYAQAKYQMNNYLNDLDGRLDEKIKLEKNIKK